MAGIEALLVSTVTVALAEIGNSTMKMNERTEMADNDLFIATPRGRSPERQWG